MLGQRVILLDGKFIGAVRNVPPKGSFLSGYADRSPYQKTELTPKEKAICDTIGPVLAQKGLFFAGVDLIGEKLIEINVTSPSGLIPLKTLYNIDADKIFWDLLQEKLSKL
jgi:glutathione synthase